MWILQLFILLNVCLEKDSDQLIVTLKTLFIYPSVKQQLTRTLFEAQIVANTPEAFLPLPFFVYLLIDYNY